MLSMDTLTLFYLSSSLPLTKVPTQTSQFFLISDKRCFKFLFGEQDFDDEKWFRERTRVPEWDEPELSSFISCLGGGDITCQHLYSCHWSTWESRNMVPDLFHWKFGRKAKRLKDRHRQNVSSHHSLSLLWQFQLLQLSWLVNFHHKITFITR